MRCSQQTIRRALNRFTSASDSLLSASSTPSLSTLLSSLFPAGNSRAVPFRCYSRTCYLSGAADTVVCRHQGRSSVRLSDQLGPQCIRYLVDSVTATASLSHRGRLRSASSQRYEQPRTRLKFGERCFAFAGPAAWNSLPSSVQELTDTTAFKHQLKTVLFQRCYSSSNQF